MTKGVLIRYLIDGRPVGAIAEHLGLDRAVIRRHLKEGGVVIRPTAGGYPGRDPVCDAVSRGGYPSFHYFAQCMAMVSTSEQSSELGVTEKSLARVYNAYRNLLSFLKVAGISLPTSQKGVDDREQQRPAE